MKNDQTPFLKSDTVRMSLAGVFVCFAAFFSLPGRGIIATVPFAVLAGALAPLINPKLKFDLPVFALALLAFSIAELEGALTIAFYVVALSLLFALGFYFVSGVLSRRLKPLFAVFGILVCFAASVFIFGDPVSFTLAQTNAVKFYRGNYPNERFLLQNTGYDPISRVYVSEFTLSNGEALTSAGAADETNDAYWRLLVSHACENRKAAMLSLFHDQLSDGTYQITADLPEETLYALYPNEEVLDDDPERLFDLYAYTVEFDRSFSTAGTREAKSEFASAVRRHIKALQDAGFPYRSIAFRGGERDQMLYELTVLPDTGAENLTAGEIKLLET